MKGVLARWLVVLFLAANTGCGTSPNTSQESITPNQPAAANAPYRLPAGAKVALAAGRSDLRVTYSDDPDYSVGHPYPYHYRKSATLFANEDISKDIEKCTAAGFFVMAPVCVVVIPILALPMGLIAYGTNTVVNTVKEAAQNESKQDTKKPKSADELAKERKAAEEKLAAMQDTIKKYLTGTNTTLDPRRPLVIRVQGYARESGVGDFLVLTNTTPQAESETPGYENQVDYVFDVAVTHIDIRPGLTTGPGAYAVEFTGTGQLIRLHDNVVVDEFTETSSKVVPLEPFTTTNARIVSERLDVALQDLAEMLVDYWIKPTIKGSH